MEVFVFTGQLDLIVATPGTLAWVENLKWKNAEAWKNATRVSVSVEGIIEGYIKEYSNLKMYWINRSGHMVSTNLYFFLSKTSTAGAFCFMINIIYIAGTTR